MCTIPRMLNRTSRFIVVAVLICAPALIAQVPTASDPPKYVLPPKNVVDVFDAEPLPQTLISPNHQVVALSIPSMSSGARTASRNLPVSTRTPGRRVG